MTPVGCRIGAGEDPVKTPPVDTTTQGGRQLNGWKDIASYLGKSVRSVQRWEVTLGLPVRRIHTPDGAIVYADADEIETWRRGLDRPRDLAEEANGDDEDAPHDGTVPATASAGSDSPRHGLRQALILAASAVILVAAGFAAGRVSGGRAGLAVEIRYVGRTVEAIGRNGAVAWTYRFEGDVSAPRNQPSLFVDLDGDGELEILVPVRTDAQGTQAGISEAIYCFNRAGVLKWKYAPDYSLSFGAERFTSPWEIQDLTVSHTGPARRIWVAYVHHTWWPGFVVEIGPSGSGKMIYAQAGRVTSVSHWPTPAGGFLAIGGAVNELQGATVALLPDRAAVASYPTRDGLPPCTGCPAGSPRRLLLVPGSELVAANNEKFPSVTATRPVGTALKVMIGEGGGASVLMLDEDFSIESFQFSDRYWAAHERFEREGRLDHTAKDCPELRKPREVKEWTPETGWSRQLLPPGMAGARTLNPAER
jgi:hypothetical protein